MSAIAQGISDIGYGQGENAGMQARLGIMKWMTEDNARRAELALRAQQAADAEAAASQQRSDNETAKSNAEWDATKNEIDKKNGTGKYAQAQDAANAQSVLPVLQKAVKTNQSQIDAQKSGNLGEVQKAVADQWKNIGEAAKLGKSALAMTLTASGIMPDAKFTEADLIDYTDPTTGLKGFKADYMGKQLTIMTDQKSIKNEIPTGLVDDATKELMRIYGYNRDINGGLTLPEPEKQAEFELVNNAMQQAIRLNKGTLSAAEYANKAAGYLSDLGTTDEKGQKTYSAQDAKILQARLLNNIGASAATGGIKGFSPSAQYDDNGNPIAPEPVAATPAANGIVKTVDANGNVSYKSVPKEQAATPLATQSRPKWDNQTGQVIVDGRVIGIAKTADEARAMAIQALSPKTGDGNRNQQAIDNAALQEAYRKNTEKFKNSPVYRAAQSGVTGIGRAFAYR